MARLIFWAGFGVSLGLAYIHIQLTTREMMIQRSHFQAESEDLWDQKRALASEVARLRGNEDVLAYARDQLQLVDLPADKIEMMRVPRTVVDRYDRVYSEIALARTGGGTGSEPEPLVARLLGAVLTPLERVQAARRER